MKNEENLWERLESNVPKEELEDFLFEASEAYTEGGCETAHYTHFLDEQMTTLLKAVPSVFPYGWEYDKEEKGS